MQQVVRSKVHVSDPEGCLAITDLASRPGEFIKLLHHTPYESIPCIVSVLSRSYCFEMQKRVATFFDSIDGRSKKWQIVYGYIRV